MPPSPPSNPNPNQTMCRSTTPKDSRDRDGDRDRIRIRSFYLRLAGSGLSRNPLPENLTLVYLPRIDGSLLEVNGSKVPAEAPAIVPLYRVRSPVVEEEEDATVYASADRVRAGEGARFEVYVGGEKAVRGAFRRGERGWGVECRGAAEGKAARAAEAVEVWVAEEGAAEAMMGRVDFAGEGRRMRRRREGFCLKLEEIPEESDGCDCLCCEGGEEEEEEMDASDVEDEMDGGDEELEMEKVRWAVDVGLWVMCLGVGLLVSRASSKALRSKFF